MTSLRIGLAFPVLLCCACASSGNPSPANGSGDGGSSTVGSSSQATSGSVTTGGGSTGASTGSGTTSGTASTSGSVGTSGGSGCGSFPLCDDFEADTAGSPPSQTLWGLTAVGGCSNGTTYSIAVDTSQAHSGTKSVKVVGGDSCGPLFFNSTVFGALAGEVYGRFYVRFPATATIPSDHVAFAALAFEADAGPLGNNQSAYLQFASIADGTTPIMEWNNNDTELPQRNGAEVATNVYPAPDVWTCIEFHSSKSAGSLEVWVNGTADANMTYVPGTTPSSAANSAWAGKHVVLDVQNISFGWVHFSGSGTNTLWFDDVAVGGSRIGCQ